MSWEGFERVLPSTARIDEGGRLEIGGVSMAELVAEHGSPAFVLDDADVRGRLAAYREAFGSRGVAYAGKAFLVRRFAELLVEEDVGLDCASGGELHTALAGGFPASRIYLHGNNKSMDELTMAVRAGVGRVVIDSALELERLQEVAAAEGSTAEALVRVTPGIEAHTHEYLQTGVEDTKFGVAIGEAALELLKRAAASPNVVVQGLHAHIGSQVFDLEPFAEEARVMTRFLARARDETGLELPELDLGGGLGIAYLPEDEPRGIAELAKLMNEAIAAASEEAGTPAPRLKVEPGRSVIGPAMVTVYTVGTIKEIAGVRRYAAVDGGMSDNLRPALYDAVYTFVSADRPGAAHDTEYAVAGKLCETGDVLRKDALLPALEVGELIVCAATGAYCYAMASNYNRLPRPPVISVRDGEMSVLARRETYEDLLRLG